MPMYASGIGVFVQERGVIFCAFKLYGISTSREAKDPNESSLNFQSCPVLSFRRPRLAACSRMKMGIEMEEKNSLLWALGKEKKLSFMDAW